MIQRDRRRVLVNRWICMHDLSEGELHLGSLALQKV